MHTHTHTHTHTHIVYIGHVFLDKLSKSPLSLEPIAMQPFFAWTSDNFNILSCPVHERN